MQTRPIKRYRRFHGYDYGRGAAMFLTFSLSPRCPLFGRIRGEQMEFSEAGRIALEVIEHESLRTPDVQLKRFVVMPDHVHLRLYLRPGQADPLRKMGRFVYNVKAWIRNHCKARLGVEVAWEENYHDRICLSREIIEAADRYIDNNPLKWSLMHGDPPPLKVEEPLDAGALPAEEWWTGVGRSDWLRGGARGAGDPHRHFVAYGEDGAAVRKPPEPRREPPLERFARFRLEVRPGGKREALRPGGGGGGPKGGGALPRPAQRIGVAHDGVAGRTDGGKIAERGGGDGGGIEDEVRLASRQAGRIADIAHAHAPEEAGRQVAVAGDAVDDAADRTIPPQEGGQRRGGGVVAGHSHGLPAARGAVAPDAVELGDVARRARDHRKIQDRAGRSGGESGGMHLHGENPTRTTPAPQSRVRRIRQAARLSRLTGSCRIG